MAEYGLLIHYQYCSGCHSCEVACKNEHDIPVGKWGIKILELGPMKTTKDEWNWDYIPTPTSDCDMCIERIKEGKDPACVHHCQAHVMDFGTAEELAKKMAEFDSKTVVFMP